MTNGSKEQRILIQGPERFNPMGGLKKLLGGFCNPPTMGNGIDDGTTAMGTSEPEPEPEPDSAPQQRHSLPAPPEVREAVAVEDDGVEITLGLSSTETSTSDDEKSPEPEPEVETINSQELEPELKTTNSRRKPRILRGLGVAVVGLLAVFVTLLTLRRLGYKMADFTFTTVDGPGKGEAVTKPLIDIKYNNVAEEPVAAKLNDIPTEAAFGMNDYVATDNNDKAKLKIDELKLMVSEIKANAV